METPESLTTCNETNVEKKVEEEKVTQDELNIKKEHKDALNCTGFEKDEWYKYYYIVKVVVFTLLISSFLLIVGMTVHVARILYLSLQKKIFISKILNKEL
ncbi:uncharacterized protein LOC100573855 [Acyrthosiphon pisum]|uniref:ACYPI26172 protein n=1 Tax=Acyrthosiphon pisum TaxID=7029 RepID=C4WX14_ACYPI|nr:uncharacterized protein LOC100573855 [Acyrthosiphon pisum]BAH72434.1 ACYPI26172 [Acyrthosiphon pisum]|eukprot:NP_001233044.1 uncharacterized protein LOC100573855 [Acyrthosiphon pisum]